MANVLAAVVIQRRREVLCIGVSDALRRELGARGLTVRQTVFQDDRIVSGLAGGRTLLRAIILGAFNLRTIPRQRDFKKMIGGLAASAARDGTAIVIEAQAAPDRDLADLLLRDALGQGYDADRTYRNVLAPPAAAQRILDYNPGPHWAPVPLSGSGLADLGAKERELIQRAVADANSAVVERLGSKKIFRVDTCMPDEPDRVPFLVKIVDDRDYADQERGNYTRFCLEAVPYFSLPPQSPERCAVGPSSACLVYHYADHAVTLADTLRTRSPVRTIAALFDGALRQWRANVGEENVALGEYFFDKRIVSSSPERYERSYVSTQQDGGTVARPPVEVLQSIREYPRRVLQTCISHGDLHARNILATEGAEEVSLIDFARTTRAPMTIDPAELEASLAFLPLDGVPNLTADEVAAFYKGDLFRSPPLSRSANKRLLGVQQVRRQIAGEVETADYANTLASSLLFYASRRSAGAYRGADWLSQARPQ